MAPESAAARAGLAVGDRLLKFAGQQVDNGDAFKQLVLAAPNLVSAMVSRPGADEDVLLTIELSGTPMRVGISWQEDRADPSMVILTRVVPGSAAEHAGLAVHDRIYSIDGESFSGGQAFGKMIVADRSDMTLQVERRGVLRNVRLQPVAAPQVLAKPIIDEPLILDSTTPADTE